MFQLLVLVQVRELEMGCFNNRIEFNVPKNVSRNKTFSVSQNPDPLALYKSTLRTQTNIASDSGIILLVKSRISITVVCESENFHRVILHTSAADLF